MCCILPNEVRMLTSGGNKSIHKARPKGVMLDRYTDVGQTRGDKSDADS